MLTQSIVQYSFQNNMSMFIYAQLT